MTFIKKLGAPVAVFAMFAMVAVSLIAPAPQSASAAAQTCTPSVTVFDNNVATNLTLTAGAGTINDNTGATVTSAAPAATVTLTNVADGGGATLLNATMPAANVAGTSAATGIVVTGGTDDCTTAPTVLTWNGLAVSQGVAISVPSHGASIQNLTVRGTIGGAPLATTTVVTLTTNKGEFVSVNNIGIPASKSVNVVLDQGTVNRAATGLVGFRGVPGDVGTDVSIQATAEQGGTSLFKTVTGAITAPTGGTPTTITDTSLSHSAIGYHTTATAGAEFQPLIRATRWVVRLTDGNGNGVQDGRIVKFETDRGYLVDATGVANTDAARNTACTSLSASTPKSIFVGTVSTGLGGTAGTTAVGRAGVILCGTSASGNQGLATLKATDNSLTSLTTSKEVTIATRPASANISASATGNVVTVTANGGNDVPAPNKTVVRFSVVPADHGSAADACVELQNGQASSTIAVTPGQTVQVLATVGETATGDCTVANTRTYGNTIVSITGTTSTGTTPTTPSGDGSLTAPSFGTGNVGSAVFAGGTVEQLAAQVTAAGGTSVWAQAADGTWVRYNTLATGATAFVNNAFNAAFAGGFAGPTAVFVVK